VDVIRRTTGKRNNSTKGKSQETSYRERLSSVTPCGSLKNDRQEGIQVFQSVHDWGTRDGPSSPRLQRANRFGGLASSRLAMMRFVQNDTEPFD
jgi:hypothetical protein